MKTNFMFEVGEHIGNGEIIDHIDDKGEQKYCFKCKICGITYSVEKAKLESTGIGSQNLWSIKT